MKRLAEITSILSMLLLPLLLWLRLRPVRYEMRVRCNGGEITEQMSDRDTYA